MLCPLNYDLSKSFGGRYLDNHKLGIESLNLFKNLLRALISYEQEIDIVRRALNAKYNFSSYECFEIIKPRKCSFFDRSDVLFFYSVDEFYVGQWIFST
jgi:hypothetical protein